MINVVIADDEFKICELIFHLIDWGSMDMSVIAIAHDGIEAYQLIQRYKPQIVITDIRMPGYSGVDLIKKGKNINSNMDFIIISGYSQFEYAKNAIHYGATDYLLKPINKEELLHSLQRIRDKYIEQSNLEKQTAEYEILAKQNTEFLRSSLLTNIYYGKIDDLDKGIDQINETYKYSLFPTSYQIVLVKADGIDFKENSENLFLFEKIRQIFVFELQDIMYDMEGCNIQNGLFIFLMNFRKKETDTAIQKMYRHILNQLLFQKDIIKGLHITIGVGNVVCEIKDIIKSCGEANWSVQQRLMVGTDKVLYFTRREEPQEYKAYFLNFTKEFEKSIEIFDYLKVIDQLKELRKDVQNDPEISGHEILQMSKAIMNLYILVMQKNGYEIPQKTQIFENFINESEDCYNLEQLFLTLNHTISKSLQSFKELRINEGTKVIRQAKEYIKIHLGEKITLEEVSNYLGYNSTYFSAMFKKECGINFTDYLVQSRVEKAKEYLKDTNESVGNICTNVGYTDIKTFTKNFKRHTGLKPSDYRKLYG